MNTKGAGFLLFLILSFITSLSGQVKVVNTGELHAYNHGYSYSDTLCSTEEYYFLVSKRNKVQNLIRLSKNFEDSIEVDPFVLLTDRGYEFVSWISYNKRLFLCVNNQTEDNNTELLLLNFDFNNLDLTGDPIRLKVFNSDNDRPDAVDIEFVSSPNSNFLSLYYCLQAKGDSKGKFAFHLFDKNFNSIWKKSGHHESKSSNPVFTDVLVNNNGALFAVGTGSVNPREKLLKSFPQKSFTFYYCDVLGNFTEKKHQFEDKYLFSFKLMEIRGKVKCFGLYNLDLQNTFKASGYFAAEFDGTNLRFKKFTPFEIDSREDYNYYSVNANTNLEIKKVFVDSEENQILVLESEYFERNFSENPDYRSDEKDKGMAADMLIKDFHARDVVLISLDKDLDTNWIRRIKKHQHALFDNTAISGVFYFENDKTYIFYSDHKSNLHRGEYSYPKVMKEHFWWQNVLYVVCVNKEGVVERQYLDGKRRYSLLKTVMFDTGDSLILCRKNRTKAQFFEVKLN